MLRNSTNINCTSTPTCLSRRFDSSLNRNNNYNWNKFNFLHLHFSRFNIGDNLSFTTSLLWKNDSRSLFTSNLKRLEKKNKIEISTLKNSKFMKRFMTTSKFPQVGEFPGDDQELMREAWRGNGQRVRELVEKYNTDVNLKSQEEPQWSALHCAALRGNNDVIRVLLDTGADPNISDQHGTPLHEAARGAHLSSFQLLLDAGANIEAVTRFLVTPRDMAEAEATGEHLGVVDFIDEQLAKDRNQSNAS
eukprot:gb/GECH01010205.1/.p1 GENE.gb/GECH01010205.1/~~gb/GECH01010205.1/.p1  ORF type:complete len:248 (+),score=49.03 gb/GECH01010205.1/:1-744(+)